MGCIPYSLQEAGSSLLLKLLVHFLTVILELTEKKYLEMRKGLIFELIGPLFNILSRSSLSTW